MRTKARAFVVATEFLTAMLFSASVVYGQEPTPTPASASSASTADKVKSDAQATASKPADAEPAPKPAPDLWHQEELTGDWGETRSRWKEKGVDLEFKLAQFYQGVASGGIRRGSEHNGLPQ